MHTFTKAERLRNRTVIDYLFSKAKSFRQPPFLIKWAEIAYCGAPVQLLIAISKKTHRSAVVRNLVKRRIREAYRKNKHILYDSRKRHTHTLALLLLYNNNEISTYQEIEHKIIVILQQLSKTDEKAPD